MSRITRCPSCGTMFKVVPDQLRISEGWVRCGHCAEVFDAGAHLQDEEAVAAAAAALAQTPSEQAETEPSGAQPTGHGEIPGDRASGRADVPDAGAPDEPAWRDPDNSPGMDEAGAAPGSSAADDGAPSQEASATRARESAAHGPAHEAGVLEAAEDLRASPQDAPFFFQHTREDRPDTPAPASTSATVLEARDEEPAIWAQSEAEPDLNDLEFVRKAQRRAVMQQRGMRALLALASVALALLLAAQYAVQERDRLAATQPGLRPALSALCLVARCSIAAPRQIDAIAIDASQFSRLRGESYRLNLTLRNQSAMAVATPAIELTLTDAQDQPVVRRVLRPAELAPASELLAPNAEWNASVGVAVAAAGLPARVAGYRVLAFYP